MQGDDRVIHKTDISESHLVNDDFRRLFAKFVREKRMEENMSQESLAFSINLGLTTLKRYEGVVLSDRPKALKKNTCEKLLEGVGQTTAGFWGWVEKECPGTWASLDKHNVSSKNHVTENNNTESGYHGEQRLALGNNVNVAVPEEDGAIVGDRADHRRWSIAVCSMLACGMLVFGVLSVFYYGNGRSDQEAILDHTSVLENLPAQSENTGFAARSETTVDALTRRDTVNKPAELTEHGNYEVARQHNTAEKIGSQITLGTNSPIISNNTGIININHSAASEKDK